ncbi:MAG: tRNA pseudouridine(54/55) synthase Pus10 [Candidatus Aenigmatarchaeota archaeon]
MEKIEEALKNFTLCNFCLGRLFSNFLTGLSNEERGKAVKLYLALKYDSIGKIEVKESNFFGIKFRNINIDIKKEKCFICNDFFENEIKNIVEKILKISKGIEFDTFLIGTKVSEEIKNREKIVFEIFGKSNVETINNDINREVGKILEKKINKKFSRENPDIVFMIELKNFDVKMKIRSIFIFGMYKKLVRGIPQAKWLCKNCKGKGCSICNYKGKNYRTSVQEIIEKPLLKAFKAEKSKFSGAGREDVDVRCLSYRPFCIEIINPRKRKVDIKKIKSKSKIVKFKLIKVVDRKFVKFLKESKFDKEYVAIVDFENEIKKDLLKDLKVLEKVEINQLTPLRVLHRRAEKLRKKKVRKISYKILSKKKLKLKIVAEHGLYIKELIHGDNNRTVPSVAQILNNKVKKIELDVVKINHSL